MFSGFSHLEHNGSAPWDSGRVHSGRSGLPGVPDRERVVIGRAAADARAEWLALSRRQVAARNPAAGVGDMGKRYIEAIGRGPRKPLPEPRARVSAVAGAVELRCVRVVRCAALAAVCTAP